MRPTRDVSSANFTMWLVLKDAVQLCVQGEEQGTEHTALGGPCAQCDAAWGVVADTYSLWPLTEEVQQPAAEGAEPQFVKFAD